MKRTDVLVASVLTLLASFVGVQAYNTRTSRNVAFGSTSLESTSEAASSTSRPRIANARHLSPDASAEIVSAESRRRLAMYSSGTYIADILAAHDSALARWPDRRGVPLRVWVQPSPDISDWNTDNIALVRNAFLTWTDAGVPINFTFVLDSASADVHVTWIDHFDEQISGKTLWTHDEKWRIVDADILLALHHRSGEALDSSAIRAISLHEVGHLVGLDHTRDTTAIMTPRVHTRDLSAADRATVQLLYALPPGSVRASAALPAQRDR
ncbi:MAG: matrixin family metalloprotease [Gemmatimonadaceae bacterium]